MDQAELLTYKCLKRASSMKYFIPSVSRWFNRYLASYTVMQWYLISFLFLLCGVVVWYMVVYRPLHARITFYKNEISLKDQALKNCLDEAITCSHAHHVIQALTQDIETIKNNYIDWNTVLVSIIHKAMSHGLDIDSCLSSDTIDYNWYTTTPVTATVLGSLQVIILWLNAVTQELMGSTLQQLRLTSEQSNQFRCSCIFHITQVKKSPSTLGS